MTTLLPTFFSGAPLTVALSSGLYKLQMDTTAPPTPHPKAFLNGIPISIVPQSNGSFSLHTCDSTATVLQWLTAFLEDGTPVSVGKITADRYALLTTTPAGSVTRWLTSRLNGRPISVGLLSNGTYALLTDDGTTPVVQSLIVGFGNAPVSINKVSGERFALLFGGSSVVPPPVNTVAPAISGTTTVGQTLTATTGTWSGTPTSYSYNWKRNGVTLGAADQNTYVLVAADIGSTITVTVTATNAGGSASGTSAATSAISPLMLLDDEFTTAESAPIVTPRTAQPGPGTLKIGQPGNQISIASTIIQASGGGAGGGVVFVVSNATLAHAAGRCLKTVAVKDASGNTSFSGWVGTNSTIDPSAIAILATLEPGFYRQFPKTAVALPSGAGITSTAKEFCFVRNADGGMWVFENGVLLFIDDVSNTSALYPLLFSASAAASTPQGDAIRAYDLGGVWAASHGIDTVNASNPSSGSLFSAATANAIHVLTFALPGSPASGHKIEVQFRIVDALNYDTAYVQWNNGTSQWDLLLDKVVAGVATNVSTVANVGSGLIKIKVRIIGTTCTVWTRGASNYTRRINSATISNNNAQTGANATYNAGTVSALNSTPTDTSTLTNGGSTYAADLGF